MAKTGPVRLRCAHRPGIAPPCYSPGCASRVSSVVRKPARTDFSSRSTRTSSSEVWISALAAPAPAADARSGGSERVHGGRNGSSIAAWICASSVEAAKVMVQGLVAVVGWSVPPQAPRVVAIVAADAKRRKRNSNLVCMGLPFDFVFGRERKTAYVCGAVAATGFSSRWCWLWASTSEEMV